MTIELMAHLSGGKCVDSFELRGVLRSCCGVVALWLCHKGWQILVGHKCERVAGSEEVHEDM